MKLTLEIQLGNEAMQRDIDIAFALIKAAQVLPMHIYGPEGTPVVGNSAPIRDANGNRVGEWKIVDDTNVKDCCRFHSLGGDPKLSHGGDRPDGWRG